LKDNTYNGWTNYATWRVNLEYFDGTAWIESLEDCTDLSAYARYLKEMVLEMMEQEASGFALSYALAFLDDVNWYEIAQSMMNQYQEEFA
jgi:hypothetical protein